MSQANFTDIRNNCNTAFAKLHPMSALTDVWLAMLSCRCSLPAPANRCGQIQMRERSPQGGRLNHMVSDQYSAVYFTSVKTLAHNSLEHAHLTSLKSCFVEICGELFFNFHCELNI